MDNWRLIITEPLSGSMNMAIDETILRSVSEGLAPPTLRFYQWSLPTVTLGYFQSLDKEVDQEACQRLGVEVVRRLTGGRAVLHHHEFTYSLAVLEKNDKIAGSVLDSYLAISRGLVEGLRVLGIDADITEGKQSKEHLSAACFDAPSWYELVAAGKKLVGSAQTRRFGGILQHGSIPIYTNDTLLFSILNFKNNQLRERAREYYLTKATALSERLEATVKHQDLKEIMVKLNDAFKRGFGKGLSLNLLEEQLTTDEINLAKTLCLEKYSSDKWNRRR